MSIKSEFGKQLDAYFSGEMKGSDRLVFEGRVESDPVFKSEFESQNEIVESLKAHRKAELKTRLDNISVEPSLIGSLLQSSALKPVVYAVTSVAVLSGSYLFYNQEAAIENHIQHIKGQKEFFTASNIQANNDLVLDYRHEPKDLKIALNQPAVSEKSDQSLNTNDVVVSDIIFEVPEVNGEMGAEEFKAPGLALEEAKRIEEVPSTAKLDKIQINTINSRRYGFHYRVEDNRLFLYGKFNESPYEIIELNTPSSKSLFFFYDGSFYNLNKEASSVTPLSRIEDKKLSDRLDRLKSSSYH
ncbi:MAG: hypothetical protein JXR07_16170 [Reichenbachiella sp.]